MNRSFNRNEGSHGPREFRGGMDDGVRPVNVGEELTVKIEAVGEKGDGIAKKDGFVLFVPNTSAGDEVKVRVTKVLRRVGFAEVIGSAEPSKQAKKEEAPEDTEDFGEESGESSEDVQEESEEKDVEEEESDKQ
ncbi:MAG: TRAM domain-containing protein [Candidatus Woesearchaeota archaeon]